MTLRKIGAARRGRVPPEIRALADLYQLHRGSAEGARHELQTHGWQIDTGCPATRRAAALSEVAQALSDMIDLADAWASCGPEGYTHEERRRRNRADRVLMRLYARIEREGKVR